MAEYLTPEQREQFMRNLEAQGGAPVESGALSPEEQQQAMQEGAQMAAADAENGQMAGADTPAAGQNEAQQDAGGAILSQLGFTSLDELANAYKETLRSTAELKDMLTRLTEVQQAAETDEDLSGPEGQIKKVIRSEFKPMYDRIKADAENRIIQEEWKKSARGKDDLQDLLPEIQSYITEHAELSKAKDGLERAYHAVRSGKYRSEASMLSDPEFLKRVSENEDVKKAVIEKHLQQIARQGDAVPQTITDGGSTPLTGKKTVSGMEQAKQKLASMLGQK